MKAIPSLITYLLLGGGFVDLSAQDQCKPIGYATLDGRSGGAVTVTGGGNATPIVVNKFEDLVTYMKDDQPRVIYVDGTLGSGWSGQSGDRLKITGKNKTLIGLKPGTRLNAVIRITEGASNIIVRNLIIVGPGSNELQGWDNLNITSEAPEIVGPKNIWIDHCEFWDGQDGNADVVLGADNVTFTWNIFGYKKAGSHNLSNLIASGNSEPISEGRLNITFMNNWWTGAAQRQPRCRYGNIHVVNNLLSKNPAIPTATTDYGMAAGKDCRILSENNYFSQIQEPFSDQFKEGSSGLESVGNFFDGTTGNQTGWGTTFTPPYEYKSFMVDPKSLKAIIPELAGATMPNPTTCPKLSPTTLLETPKSTRPRLVSSRRNLIIEGFENHPVELELFSLSGENRIQRSFTASPSHLVMDFSSTSLAPGFYLAVAKANGKSTSVVYLQIERSQ